jgi:hypothetical protein
VGKIKYKYHPPYTSWGKQAIWLATKKECEPKRTKTRTFFTEDKKRPLGFTSRSLPVLGTIYTM